MSRPAYLSLSSPAPAGAAHSTERGSPFPPIATTGLSRTATPSSRNPSLPHKVCTDQSGGKKEKDNTGPREPNGREHCRFPFQFLAPLTP